MNNLKRVLSLALASVMLVGMMVVSSSAADFTDADKISKTDAVNTLVALNVINGKDDGSFDPEGTVTRSQMAKMICVALNGGKDFKYGVKAEPTYSDIKGHWAESYIEYCTSLGIIAGQGNGTFAPDAPVTGSAAAKMMLVAIGYDADEEVLKGADWEVNTNRLASNKNFYENLSSINVSEGLSRENAAQLIWNACDANMVEYDYKLISNSSQLSTKGVAKDKMVGGVPVDLLGDRFNLRTQKGYLTEASYNSNKKEFTYNVLDENVALGTALAPSNHVSVTAKADFTALYGEKVKMLYKPVTNGLELFGIYSISDTVETALWGAVAPGTSDTAVKVNGTKYKVATNVGALPVYFGTDANADKWASLGANVIDEASSVKFIDDDGDNKIDWLVVTEATVGKITFKNSTSVTINGVGSLNLEDDVAEIYDGAKKDDYAVATKSDFTDKWTVTKAEVITGKVSAVKDTNTVKIDDNWYDNASSVAAGKLLSSSSVGKTYEIVAVGGYYYDTKLTNEAGVSTDILFLSAADQVQSTLGVNTIKGKAYFTDGSSKPITIARIGDDTVTNKFSGTDGTDRAAVAPSELPTSANYTNAKVQTQCLYRYTVNSDNEYSLFLVKNDNDVNRAGYEKYTEAWTYGQFKDSDNRLYSASGTSFTIADDAVIFVSVTTSGKQDVKVINGKTMKTWGDFNATASNGATQILTNKISGFDTVKVASLISKAETTISGDATANYGYITSDTYLTENAAGDASIPVTMWTVDGEVTLELTKKVGGTAVAIGDLASIKKGNIVTYELDNKGYGVNVATFGTDCAVTALSGKNLELTATGDSANSKAYKIDNDTKFIYIDSANKKGVEGGEFQMATETPVDDLFVKNVTVASGAAENSTLSVVFVDVTNCMNGKDVARKGSPVTTTISAADLDAKTVTRVTGKTAVDIITNVSDMFNNVIKAQVFKADGTDISASTTATDITGTSVLILTGSNGKQITLTFTA